MQKFKFLRWLIHQITKDPQRVKEDFFSYGGIFVIAISVFLCIFSLGFISFSILGFFMFLYGIYLIDTSSLEH